MIKQKEITVSNFEGGIVCWDSGEMPVDNMNNALDSIGMPELKPNVDSFRSDALRQAVTAFAKRMVNPQRSEPVETHKLEGVLPAFAAEQVTKTDTDVTHTDICHVRLTPLLQVEIFKHNDKLLTQLSSKLAMCEQAIQSYYDFRMGVVPASVVTSILNKILTAMKCCPMLRKRGGVYQVPSKDNTDVLENFASHIPNESNLSIAVAPINIDPSASAFKQLAVNAKAKMDKLLKTVETGLQEVGDKQRKNGAETRMAQCQEVVDYAEAFANVLGQEDYDFYMNQVSKMQDAISVHSVVSVLS